ncbi:MAG: ATP synthase F1 subunit delta [Ignavibacteria bacterium]|nr:ATP synthase F1 subunit delta [Ignavibacteria bacterium]
MTNKKVARKYNTALYLTAEDLKVTDKIKNDLWDIKRSITASRELANFLLTPVISSEKKSSVINALFKGKVDNLTLKFLEFLCEKNRIQILAEIADDFADFVNEKHGIVSAKIKTAVEINDTEKKNLSKKLKQYTGKEINAAFTVDPSIKGGFIANIDDRIIDASIIRQLELLKEKLAGGNFNN